MSNRRSVLVAAEVRAILGPDLVRSIEIGPEVDDYTCWVCGQVGLISSGRRVSVLAFCGPSDVAVGIAHASCSRSRVQDTPEYRPAADMLGDVDKVDTLAVIRAARDGSGPIPRAIVMLAPRVPKFVRAFDQLNYVDQFVREYVELGFEVLAGSLATASFPPGQHWEAEWTGQAHTSLALFNASGEQRPPWRIGGLLPEWSALVSADCGFGMIAGSYLWLESRSPEHFDKTIADGNAVGAMIRLR